jgi:hypothetical protein
MLRCEESALCLSISDQQIQQATVRRIQAFFSLVATDFGPPRKTLAVRHRLINDRASQQCGHLLSAAVGEQYRAMAVPDDVDG